MACGVNCGLRPHNEQEISQDLALTIFDVVSKFMAGPRRVRSVVDRQDPGLERHQMAAHNLRQHEG